MIFSRAVLSAALLLGLSLTLPGDAEAARYQKYLNGNCPNTICTINFPIVPAGKTLVLTNVSCYVRLNGTDAELYAQQLLQVGAGGGVGVAVTLASGFRQTIDALPNQVVLSSNHAIDVFATAGQRFQAYAEVRRGTFSQFACHISGQLLP